MLPITRWLILFLLILTPVSGLAEGGGDKNPANQVNYIPLTPSFVLNVGAPSDSPAFLKVDATLEVDNKADVKTVEHYEPALRNALVMMLSGASLDQASDARGQEQLRKEALKALNAIVKKYEGKDMLKNLLFTTFIVQQQ